MSGSETVRSDQTAKNTTYNNNGYQIYKKKKPKVLQVHGINKDKIFTKSTDVAAFFYSHFFKVQCIF